MAGLTSERVIALKTALYHDAVAHNYVADGFRIYKRENGQVIPVPTVGTPCRTMISRYQRLHRLPVDGTFNTKTQNRLIPPVVRQGWERVVEVAHTMIELAPCAYTQTRPYAGSLAAFSSNGGDCSGSSILAYKIANQPDPNGTSFNGSGNTWSLIGKGERVVYGTERGGDLSFYGAHQDDPEHVTVELGGGWVMSHGHAGGPLLLPRLYRSDYLQTRRYDTT